MALLYITPKTIGLEEKRRKKRKEEQQYAIRIRYKGTRVHQATPPLRGCKKDRLTGAYSRF
jgi:hypothetical protein